MSSDSLSSLLRSARKKQEVTFEQISQRTGISEEFVKNIEKGNYDLAKQDVYFVGKLRSYAGFLGINSEEIESLYEIENGQETKKKSKQLKHSRKVKSPIVTTNVMAQAAILIVIATVVGYVFWQVILFASSPRLIVAFPEENQTHSEGELEVVGSTTPGSEVTVDGQSVYVSEDGSFRFTVSLDEGVHTLNLESRSGLGRTSELARTVVIENASD